MHTQKISTKRIVLTALMAALTVVGSTLRITLPVSVMGTTAFHLGNIFCALSGILLGPALGGLAAGLGSAIYDMFNPLYIAEAWITFLMKGAYGLATGLIVWKGKKAYSYGKTVIGTVVGALVYAALYLGKNFLKGVWVKGLAPAASALLLVEKVPATAFNAIVAIICAPLLGKAIRAALERNHMSLN